MPEATGRDGFPGEAKSVETHGETPPSGPSAGSPGPSRRASPLPPGVGNGIIAFTFAIFLVTVALWPAAPGEGPATEVIETPTDHSGHESTGAGINLVGKEPYSGPITADEVRAACVVPAVGEETIDCFERVLKALLLGKGAIAAFDALDNLTTDPEVSGLGHTLAHELGMYAFVAYGSIHTALENCSYKAFQGCFHGALQSYLDGLQDVASANLQDLCPKPDVYRQSTCVHGIGHGLMLNTNANVNQSLALCDLLDAYNAQSCWSGVFMENLVGFTQHQIGEGHHHGNETGAPGYIVQREGDPYFPCSVVAPKYQATCWVQMADYILNFNGSDFKDAAEKCDAAPPGFVATCRQRIGTDSHGWYHNVDLTVMHCSYGNATHRPNCIRGMAADAVLYFFSPEKGIEVCKQVPAGDKPACYQEVASQGIGMVGKARMAQVCETAETEYVQGCRLAAGLGAA